MNKDLLKRLEDSGSIFHFSISGKTIAGVDMSSYAVEKGDRRNDFRVYPCVAEGSTRDGWLNWKGTGKENLQLVVITNEENKVPFPGIDAVGSLDFYVWSAPEKEFDFKAVGQQGNEAQSFPVVARPLYYLNAETAMQTIKSAEAARKLFYSLIDKLYMTKDCRLAFSINMHIPFMRKDGSWSTRNYTLTNYLAPTDGKCYGFVPGRDYGLKDKEKKAVTWCNDIDIRNAKTSSYKEKIFELGDPKASRYTFPIKYALQKIYATINNLAGTTTSETRQARLKWAASVYNTWTQNMKLLGSTPVRYLPPKLLTEYGMDRDSIEEDKFYTTEMPSCDIDTLVKWVADHRLKDTDTLEILTRVANGKGVTESSDLESSASTAVAYTSVNDQDAYQKWQAARKQQRKETIAKAEKSGEDDFFSDMDGLNVQEPSGVVRAEK